MKKTFKYRVYPSKKQVAILNQTLDECRWLYNHLLEQRKNSWEKDKQSISCFDQCNTLKTLKEERPSLKSAHSQILQDVAFRIDFAFKNFFRRVKSGEKPGYPRFRSESRYDSFTYPQVGFSIAEDKKTIRLSKIGNIKIKYHRPIEGIIKTCTIKRTRTEKWSISFSCIVEAPEVIHPVKNAIGIDVGLKSFAVLSNGEKVANPRFFKQEEKNLARAQRKFSAIKKGMPERRKYGKVVCRIHERISNKRYNFSHQLSRMLVNRFDLIAIEDLSINDMKKDNFRCINKSIGDAAWNMLFDQLSYKAEYAGTQVVKINPAHTSQTCSRCGNRQKLKLSERIFICHCCSLSIDRDFNASLNILALGTQGFPDLPDRSPTL